MVVAAKAVATVKAKARRRYIMSVLLRCGPDLKSLVGIFGDGNRGLLSVGNL